MILDMLCELFGDAGHRVERASSADEAVELLSVKGDSFDLLITDVRMAGMHDGFALAIWTREHLPSIEIIIISGYAGPAETSAHEFDAFVPKPFVAERLLDTARTLIGSD